LIRIDKVRNKKKVLGPMFWRKAFNYFNIFNSNSRYFIKQIYKSRSAIYM